VRFFGRKLYQKKENIFFGNVKKISTFALPNGTKLKGRNEARESKPETASEKQKGKQQLLT